MTVRPGDHEWVDPRLSDDQSNEDRLFDQAVVSDQDGGTIDLGDTRRLELAKYLRKLVTRGEFPPPPTRPEPKDFSPRLSRQSRRSTLRPCNGPRPTSATTLPNSRHDRYRQVAHR